MGLVDAVAAPRTVTLAGKEYTLRPLTWRQWGEFCAWVQDEYVAGVNRMAACMERGERMDLVREATETARGFDEQSQEVKDKTKTPNGSARLLWMSLRAAHPEMTHDAVLETMVADAVTAANAMQRFNEANFAGGTKGEAEPDGGAEKKAATTGPDCSAGSPS